MAGIIKNKTFREGSAAKLELLPNMSGPIIKTSVERPIQLREGLLTRPGNRSTISILIKAKRANAVVILIINLIARNIDSFGKVFKIKRAKIMSISSSKNGAFCCVIMSMHNLINK